MIGKKKEAFANVRQGSIFTSPTAMFNKDYNLHATITHRLGPEFPASTQRSDPPTLSHKKQVQVFPEGRDRVSPDIR